MPLAKVIIAAAWADGDLSTDEINELKTMLNRLPQSVTRKDVPYTAAESATLDIYMAAPVSIEERARLVSELQNTLQHDGDRQLALHAIEQVLSADRVMTPEERSALDEIQAALNSVDLSIFARIGRLFRSQAQSVSGPNRERYLEDFLNNRIYFQVRQRLGLAADADLGVSDEAARTLSLAGGLLAYIANVDKKITPAELQNLIETLKIGWSLSDTAAALVAEAAISEITRDIDLFQLTRAYGERSSAEDRIRLLDALFAVAAVDGEISSAEQAELSRIASQIYLTSEDVAAARMRRQSVAGAGAG
ncbi:hypothetical protein HC891_11475 [Candidatus Gracilibacteria bacterium]|nr:hypothetical protein [Candidatus Gracilibacteria bacterium]